MKYVELPVNDDYLLEKQPCITTATGKTLLGNQGQITFLGAQEFRLLGSRAMVTFTMEDRNNAKILQEYLEQKHHVIGEITHHPPPSKGQNSGTTEEERFFCRILVFSLRKTVGNWDICVSEDILQQLSKLPVYRNVKPKEIFSRLQNNLVFHFAGKPHFSFSAGSHTGGKQNPTDPSAGKRSMRIYGRDFSLIVQIETKNSAQFMTIKRVDRFPSNIPAMLLAEGELTFSSQEKFVALMAKNILEEDAHAGYTKIWEKYALQEGNFLFLQARKIGLLYINNSSLVMTSQGHYKCNLTGNEANTPLNELIETLKLLKGNLLFSDAIPRYLEEETLTWAEDAKLPRQILQRISVQFQIDKQGTLELTFPKDKEFPTDKPFLSWDITGDVRQIQRREGARQRIVDGTAANPLMGLVINGVLPQDMSDKSPHIDSISHSIKEKIFKNPPTPIQLEAIDLAINTPDIAVIQGPPGTGKTTVVTAVIERLNQLADKKRLQRGEVLITSFQHDAVRNVIERLTVNSLPTIKYGRKSDLTQDEAVDTWCEQLQQRIEEKNPEFVTHVQEDQLHQSYRLYLNAPSNSNGRAFLQLARRFAQSGGIAQQKDLMEQINQIEESIPIEPATTSDELLFYIKNLRVTPKGFEDDGTERAAALLYYLEDTLPPDGLKRQNDHLLLLKKASTLTKRTLKEGGLEALLEELQQLQLDLISSMIPPLVGVVDLPKEEILALYPRLRQQVKEIGNPQNEILYELLQELRENRDRVAEAVGAYSFVFAATTQQSMGKEITTAKDQKEHLLSYQTVVVDEAARVNPGDLMIPLSQAKRRVILVGDHRQLPHIYNEEVFKALKQEEELGDDLSHVGTTMFQYLIDQAKKLTKNDSVPRFITLDRQYRMHPLLGQFVSDNFYEKHGEAFDSPLDASYFKQNLEPKPLVWVDTPHHCGDARRVSSSWVRDCEVEYILNQICTYMFTFQTEEEKSTSFGVISFYAQQVLALEKKKKEKMKEFPQIARMLEKVRIGSVDSFQGMEFDVIFLSVVRTHKNAPHFEEKLLCQQSFDSEEEEQAHKGYVAKIGSDHYGFLTSENRLCVSLSRQKKLLIVVGNSSIFHENSWGTVAKHCIPAMQNLYHLCLNEGVIKKEGGN